MPNLFTRYSLLLLSLFSFSSFSAYPEGCEDPAYIKYIDARDAQFNIENRRTYAETKVVYETSEQLSTNQYKIISDLSRHLKYSAQFDPIPIVEDKINRLFELAERLPSDERIAAKAFDNFSNENHSVGIARAWIAYRQNKYDEAFTELIDSVELNNSALMASFGPDFDFIRHIYSEGHVKPVLQYIEKTESFWEGPMPDSMRRAWRAMIQADCPIQFQSIDRMKARQLGLKVRDLSKEYGID